MYNIAILNDIKEFHQADEFTIDHYLWGSVYQPKVTGRLAYLEGRAFLLEMVCHEANPTRVYGNPDDPVYKDSSMEAFLNFKPDAPEPGYINFEMNANGALLCAFGTNRYDRVFLRQTGTRIAIAEAQIEKARWKIELSIPLALIEHVYGKVDFQRGYALRGNFYKCGDETPFVHYGAWSEVHSEKPDFHLPQYFGDMVLQ